MAPGSSTPVKTNYAKPKTILRKSDAIKMQTEASHPFTGSIGS